MGDSSPPTAVDYALQSASDANQRAAQALRAIAQLGREVAALREQNQAIVEGLLQMAKDLGYKVDDGRESQ